MLALFDLTVVVAVMVVLYLVGRKLFTQSPTKKVEEKLAEAVMNREAAQKAEELNVEQFEADKETLNNIDKL
jgi:hypothetical protein